MLKVNQYFPPLTCQISSVSISKLIIWQYLSITGPAKFAEKLDKNILVCLCYKSYPTLLFCYHNNLRL